MEIAKSNETLAETVVKINTVLVKLKKNLVGRFVSFITFLFIENIPKSTCFNQ